LLTATIPKLLDLKDNAGLTFLGLVDKVTSIPVNVTDGILDDHAPYKRKSGMSAFFKSLYNKSFLTYLAQYSICLSEKL